MNEELQALAQAWRAQGIDSVLCTFTDLLGAVKGKQAPIDRLPTLIRQGAGFSGPSIWGTGLPRLGPRSEYMARLIPSTLRALPFMPGVAHAVCDGYAGGQALATCSRQLLQQQLRRLDAYGWRLQVGIEPEFFVFRRDAQGRLVPADEFDRLSKPSYDLQALLRQQPFLNDLQTRLQALGFEIEQVDHEDAWGQFEVNYRYDEALAAADRFQLFKFTAQQTAEAHGLVFSCMPKPYADQPGSGLHLHLSLVNAQGQAPMADAQGALGLSASGHAWVAGLLHHADALCALSAPSVNSYRRLSAGSSISGTSWAPVCKTVGSNNRSALVRTVAGRIEWRLPDPSCNIYLALAGAVAAGLSGLEQGLPPVVPCEIDLFEAHARGEPIPGRLPRDLCAALDALQADAVLQRALGGEFCAQALAYGRAQWDAFNAQVTPWEWAHCSAS